MKKSISAEMTTVMGIDLGDRFSRVAIVDASGTVTYEDRVATRVETLTRLFDRPPVRVIIEAGTHSPWVSRLATASGHQCVVANPRKVKLISANKGKRDRVDARLLARLGRADVELLHPVRHRSEQAQLHRTWLVAREAAVQSRTALINHVRGIVKSIGSRLPACSAEAFVKKTQPFIPEALRSGIEPLLPVLEQLTEVIRGYDKAIAAISRRHYPVVERLEQVPGVGPLTALSYVLTIEDPRRFDRSRSVGAYLGLVPATHDSGEQVSQMHITKQGDEMLRRLLVNAAHYVMGPFGPDSDLRRHGLRIAERGGGIAKKRAVVAVARKLAVLLHALWRSGTAYEPLLNSRVAGVA